MSTARIHTCFPATEEGRMNEYDWSEVALTQNIVVYVPVVGSLLTTFVEYVNTKLSPSVFVLCLASREYVKVVPGRLGTWVMREYCCCSLARPPVDDQVRPTLSSPPDVVDPPAAFCVPTATFRYYVPA